MFIFHYPNGGKKELKLLLCQIHGCINMWDGRIEYYSHSCHDFWQWEGGTESQAAAFKPWHTLDLDFSILASLPSSSSPSWFPRLGNGQPHHGPQPFQCGDGNCFLWCKSHPLWENLSQAPGEQGQRSFQHAVQCHWQTFRHAITCLYYAPSKTSAEKSK